MQSSPTIIESRRGDFVRRVLPGRQLSHYPSESVRFLAHRTSLLIARQLLLGKIQNRIAADDLVAIRASGTEYENSDSAELVIEYKDTDQAYMQRLVLLRDFDFEAVAYVAAELRDACPPLGSPDTSPARFAWRFSIAQIMFFTVLVAAISAPFAVSERWGWLYAIQLVAVLLCVTTFSGVKALGIITRRSWTMPEILAAGICSDFYR